MLTFFDCAPVSSSLLRGVSLGIGGWWWSLVGGCFKVQGPARFDMPPNKVLAYMEVHVLIHGTVKPCMHGTSPLPTLRASMPLSFLQLQPLIDLSSPRNDLKRLKTWDVPGRIHRGNESLNIPTQNTAKTPSLDRHDSLAHENQKPSTSTVFPLGGGNTQMEIVAESSWKLELSKNPNPR